LLGFFDKPLDWRVVESSDFVESNESMVLESESPSRKFLVVIVRWAVSRPELAELLLKESQP